MRGGNNAWYMVWRSAGGGGIGSGGDMQVSCKQFSQ